MGAPATPQIIGRYAIHARIASGGMATVHLGRLLGEGGFSRTVAIKRLHPHLADEPEFLSTMMDEAKLASRIHHPNVVPTLDIVSTEDDLLIVMEYVRGESLTRLLRVENAEGRRMPLSIASAIVIGALHGLHAAHEATNDRGEPLGIVHRDVSPQNILVGVDGLARVIDFGVAKAAGRLQTTRDGVVKGKLAYMAPEQVAGHEVTRRVDVYAMAAVFWEMLVGRRRFHADTDAEVYGLVLAGGSDPPSRHASDIPPALDAFLLKGLSVEPSRRFATAKEMAETLLRVLPPAFPTDVGAWVEQTAREALARREALLAEVESGSGSGVVSRFGGVRREDSQGELLAEDDILTVGSQPSSLSVETPKRTLVPAGSPGLRLSSLSAAGLFVGAMVVAGSLAALMMRERQPSGAPSGAGGEPARLEAGIALPVLAVPPSTAPMAVPPVDTASSSAQPDAAAPAVSVVDLPPATARAPAPPPPPHIAPPPRRAAPAPPVVTATSPLSHDRH